MEKLKVAVVHFHPLEQYPPVMNMISFLQSEVRLKLAVCSTRKSAKGREFEARKAQIHRFGRQGASIFSRYLCYILFNSLSVLKLFIFRPKAVLCYETYSVFPIFVYSRFFRDIRVFVHFHEYTSPGEITQSSLYMKWLHKLEHKLLKDAEWISQTNEDRARMFQTDRELYDQKIQVLPNYPPLFWYQSEKSEQGDPIKLVYVGALSMDTMHTEAFVNWVRSRQGKFILDIYSDNVSEEARKFLKGIEEDGIRLKSAVSYYELPDVLTGYDVGVVLYNGHIPNYVYNVPNKVLEYFACGLEIWCSKDLISVIKFKKDEELDSIRIVDFASIDESLSGGSAAKKGNRTNQKSFYAEREYSRLSKILTS